VESNVWGRFGHMPTFLERQWLATFGFGACGVLLQPTCIRPVGYVPLSSRRAQFVIVGGSARVIPPRLGWVLHRGLQWDWECVPSGVYEFLTRESVHIRR